MGLRYGLPLEDGRFAGVRNGAESVVDGRGGSSGACAQVGVDTAGDMGIRGGRAGASAVAARTCSGRSGSGGPGGFGRGLSAGRASRGRGLK